jgi:hypothetical protein
MIFLSIVPMNLRDQSSWHKVALRQFSNFRKTVVAIVHVHRFQSRNFQGDNLITKRNGAVDEKESERMFTDHVCVNISEQGYMLIRPALKKT